MTRTHLVLRNDITVGEYEMLAMFLGAAHEATQWAIGDLILQGERLFREEFAQYVEALGLSSAQRSQYARVCSRVDPSRRLAELTWSHHRSVASLEPDEQSLWLARARDEGWSKLELDEHLREARGDDGDSGRVRGYVVEVVADAAERVFGAAVLQDDGGFYLVPVDVFSELARALGVDEA
jgi:hypothetical protein